METNFKEYIKHRLKDIQHISDPEIKLVLAADAYNLSGRYKLLYIYERQFVIYDCSINSVFEPAKVSILTTGQSIKHKLSTILKDSEVNQQERNSLFALDETSHHWVFDAYLNTYCNLGPIINLLSRELKKTGIDNKDELIVAKNIFSKDIALKYVIQSITSKVYFLEREENNTNLDKRIDIKEELRISKVGILAPMNTLMNLRYNEIIYVPLETESLESTFFGKTKWKDILKDFSIKSKNDVLINDTPCKTVRLQPYIDAYGNVFISVYSINDNKYHNCIIAGPGAEFVNTTYKHLKNNINNICQNSLEKNTNTLPTNHRKEKPNNKTDCYIIDTNVFIDSPQIIKKIDCNCPIILSGTVIDELDNKKKDFDTPNKKDQKKKRNVEMALQFLNKEAKKTHKIIFEEPDTSLLPTGMNKHKGDNKILSIAIKYKKTKNIKESMNPIVLTSDNGFQLQCQRCNINTISLNDLLTNKY